MKRLIIALTLLLGTYYYIGNEMYSTVKHSVHTTAQHLDQLGE